MDSINNIWDDPVVDDVPKRLKTPADDEGHELSPRPTKRARQSLFLAGSDDDSDGPGLSTRRLIHRPPSERDIDIDALFAESDSEGEEPSFKPLPVVNADELERRAEARHRQSMPLLTPHPILPSSSPSRADNLNKESGKAEKQKETKQRRKPAILDEGRLLGPNGFPKLIKDTKNLKIKGKGHESTDLSRLLQIYQFWAHQLYPKTQFKDTVQRIEKLCHSKRMVVALSVWRDDSRGVADGDGDEADNILDLTKATPTSVTEGHDENSPRQSRDPKEGPESRSSSPPPSRPPTSASERDNYDDEIDAFWSSEGTPALFETNPYPSLNGGTGSDDAMGDESNTLWAAVDVIDSTRSQPSKLPTSRNIPTDDDEDMWDLVKESEADLTSKEIPSVKGLKESEKSVALTNSLLEDDWEDMYV